jgi:hypothetical protein
MAGSTKHPAIFFWGTVDLWQIRARVYSGLTQKEVTLLTLLTPNSWAEGAEGTHKNGITLL